MFDDNAKQAWQSITPGPELKAKALQQPKKVVCFPGNLIKTTAAVAACLIIAVNVMGLGESLVSVNGQSTSPANICCGPSAATKCSISA